MSWFNNLKKHLLQEMSERLPWTLMAYIAGICFYFELNPKIHLWTLICALLGIGGVGAVKVFYILGNDDMFLFLIGCYKH